MRSSNSPPKALNIKTLYGLPLDDNNQFLITFINIPILNDILMTNRSEQIGVNKEQSRGITKLFYDNLGTKILSCKTVYNGDYLGIVGSNSSNYIALAYCDI